MRKAETSFEMASNGPGASEVNLYTTHTIVDHPGAKIVDKGLIAFTMDLRWIADNISNNVAVVTEKAKARAKKLDANAIVGMKITDSNGEYTFIGTAVRYFK